MDDPDNNFLIALSAIAANKSITGYSHIPTDTVLVLDVSGSMNSDNNNAVSELITAANEAIATLQAVNNHNRVGVVMYSGTYTRAYTTINNKSTDRRKPNIVVVGRFAYSQHSSAQEGFC